MLSEPTSIRIATPPASAANARSGRAPHVVYLSAGMRGADRAAKNAIMSGAPMHAYIDPDTHGLSDPVAYTAYDLKGVDRATIVLVILSSENPSMHGVMLEAGYALYKRKEWPMTGPALWVVDLMDRDPRDPRMAMLDMARVSAHRIFASVEEAIEALRNE